MNAFSPRPDKPRTNQAAWLVAKRGAIKTGPAPYPSPREHEIVVANAAVAINPIDWILPLIGDVMFSWLNYPLVLGSDVAGEVVEIGSAVSRFKVGDRVLGHAVGLDKHRNSSAEGAFQAYTVLLDHMASPIPDSMGYETASVLPLGLSTAACGLFQKDHLALQHPSAHPHATGKTVLIWGGSTSVGSNAIQLAVAAGYDVVTTASPGNFAYVKSLGARQAFDYNSPTVVADIVAALKGRTIAGALAIGTGSAEYCVRIVHACDGTQFVSCASPPVSFNHAASGGSRLKWLVPLMGRMVSANLSTMLKCRAWGIRTKFIFGSSLINNEVSRVIYADFLPQALAENRYAALPTPQVAGHGLDRIAAAMEMQKQGVSASKVIVTL